jgi:polyferredoxin
MFDTINKIFNFDIFNRTLLYFLLASFSLIIALSWNTAFTNMIQKVFPNKESNITGQFVYAIILTLCFVIFIVLFVDKFVEKQFLQSFNKTIFTI